MKRGFPILAVVTALLLSFALYEALIAAPTERTMGDVQRIFYYHVPSAWTAFLLFLINFRRFGGLPHPAQSEGRHLATGQRRSGRRVLHGRDRHRADLGAAGVGNLVGAGDIRLTTTLVLWLIYISYLC